VRFLSPIGSDEERRSLVVPPGKWTDATGYARYYQIKPGVTNIHTGNDWNLNYPNFDADAHSKVYAIGPGVVTYAQKWPNPNAWGWIIVVNHGIVDGLPCYSRSAHVEFCNVVVGQIVNEWTHLADVGNGNGMFAYHLHFDISLTDQLAKYPGDWPGTRMDLVKLNYTDPVPWLKREHTIDVSPIPPGEQPPPPPPDEPDILFTQIERLAMRTDHRTNAGLIRRLPKGTKVLARDIFESPLYRWRKCEVGTQVGWICERENQDFYLLPEVAPLRVRATATLNIRAEPKVTAAKLGTVARDQIVEITPIVQNGYAQLVSGGWVLFSYLIEVA
jgi:hypothetical protein